MVDSESKNQLIKAYQWQEEFLSLRDSYCIGDHNKAYIYYKLSKLMLENVEDRKLRKVFAYAICDEGFLLDRYTFREGAEVLHSYLETEKRLRKFSTLVQEERSLYLQWQHIINQSSYKCDLNDSDKYDEELVWVCHLFRETFEVSESQSPELARNLQYLLMECRGDDSLGLITPLYLFLIITRHTNRLSQNPDFEATKASLWKHKEYGIEKNNGKNFSQYERYIILFQKLCKYYKKNSRVNIELCKYGMEQTSNLAEWVSNWFVRKEKKCITKLHRFVKELYLSCIEVDEPKEYSIRNFVIHKEAEENILCQYDLESDLWMALTIKNYVLNNINLLIDFMEYHYDNLDKVKCIITEVYHDSGFARIAPGNVSEGTKLMYVYEQLIEMLDDAIVESVWQSTEFIVKKVSENMIPISE